MMQADEDITKSRSGHKQRMNARLGLRPRSPQTQPRTFSATMAAKSGSRGAKMWRTPQYAVIPPPHGRSFVLGNREEQCEFHGRTVVSKNNRFSLLVRVSPKRLLPHDERNHFGVSNLSTATTNKLFRHHTLSLRFLGAAFTALCTVRHDWAMSTTISWACRRRCERTRLETCCACLAVKIIVKPT